MTLLIFIGELPYSGKDKDESKQLSQYVCIPGLSELYTYPGGETSCNDGRKDDPEAKPTLALMKEHGDHGGWNEKHQIDGTGRGFIHLGHQRQP